MAERANQTTIGSPSILPQVRQSPFSTKGGATMGGHLPLTTTEQANKSHNIVIKSYSGSMKGAGNGSVNDRQSDIFSVRESAIDNPLRGLETSSPFSKRPSSRNRTHLSKTVDSVTLQNQLAISIPQLQTTRTSQVRQSDTLTSIPPPAV